MCKAGRGADADEEYDLTRSELADAFLVLANQDWAPSEAVKKMKSWEQCGLDLVALDRAVTFLTEFTEEWARGAEGGELLAKAASLVDVPPSLVRLAKRIQEASLELFEKVKTGQITLHEASTLLDGQEAG